MVIHRLFRGSDQGRVVGKAQVIVGAEVQQRPVGTLHPHPGALRRDYQPFALCQPFGVDAAQHVLKMGQEGGWFRHR